MPLPARLRADQNRDVASGIEPHLRGFLAHRAADLDIGTETDAAHQSLLLRGLGALGKLLPVGNVHRALHVCGEVAGIINFPGGRCVRHCLRLDEILAADRVGRHAELARRRIDKALDHIGGLRASGSAIGIHRHSVGEHRADAAIKRLNIVEAGQHSRATMRNIRPEG